MRSLGVWILVHAIALFTLFSVVYGVDRAKFRTCHQTAFCRRLRVPLDSDLPSAPATRRNRWAAQPSTLEVDTKNAQLKLQLKNLQYPSQPALELTATLLRNGVARVRVTENQAIIDKYGARWEPRELALVDESPTLQPEPSAVAKVLDSSARLCNTPKDKSSTGTDYFRVCLVVSYEPFKIALVHVNSAGRDVELMSVNDSGLFDFEQRRTPTAPTEDPQSFPPLEPDMWEERFREFLDTKPNGPTSLSVDVTFPEATHVYGLPEHATSFALKSTRKRPAVRSAAGSHRVTDATQDYSEPFRLYNLDVFEYELDNSMSLYGAVPLLYSHVASATNPRTSGFFFLNAAEMFVDVEKYENPDSSRGIRAHFIAETGNVDLFLLSGLTPRLVNAQYMSLTGLPIMPPRFSVGYHQCRWSYKSQMDIMHIDRQFDAHDIPYDTLWLDIDHTNGKRYFTWDLPNYPRPSDMQLELAKKGRHMVTIIDPHIKRDPDYFVFKDALALDVFVKDKQKKVFEGWCWPGSSSYIDFFLDRAKPLWKSLFRFENYSHSTPFLHTWNDMNEPSVFSGPEVSMPKDALHLDGKVEHREVHNAYGLAYHETSTRGLLERQLTVVAGITPDEWASKLPVERLSPGAINPKLVEEAEKAGRTFGLSYPPGPARVAHRPFVLSRSFFAGTQRTGAIWTGDNASTWPHLSIATPMLLTMAITGIQFSGADVGGFFGNPGPELMERWLQAAAYTPFYRAHAHSDTKRREPYLFGEPHTSRMRDAIRQRYVNFPYIYTQFALANATGAPPMRPAFFEFPTDVKAAAEESIFLLGDALLIRPVTEPGVKSVPVFLPGQNEGQVWYDLATGARYQATVDAPYQTVPAPPERTPVLIRGGRGILQQTRARKNLWAMIKDPYTIIFALNGSATPGQVVSRATFYHDDGVSMNFKQGHYLYREFTVTLTSSDTLVIKSGKVPLPSIDTELAQAFGTSDIVYSASVSAEGSTRVNAENTQLKLTRIEEALITTKVEFGNKIERIILYGVTSNVKQVVVENAADGHDIPIQFTQGDAGDLTLRVHSESVFVAEDFTIRIELLQ